MKCDAKIQNFGFGLVAVGLLTIGASALALTENPYGSIVGRNAFALKPPTPLTPSVTPAVVQPPSIELQGITTILGRPQVLLKIKLPARPPEPAKDQSVVLDVGQREGEVEVLEINVAAGAVKLRNQGAELPLNMQDNAAKPAAGPALPATTLGGPISVPAPNLGLPPVPPTARPGGGTGVQPVGAPTLPTRSLRSGAATGAAATPSAAGNSVGGFSASGNAQASYQPPDTGLTLEQQMAILAVQKEADHDGTAALLPPIPPKYQPK